MLRGGVFAFANNSGDGTISGCVCKWPVLCGGVFVFGKGSGGEKVSGIVSCLFSLCLLEFGYTCITRVKESALLLHVVCLSFGGIQTY